MEQRRRSVVSDRLRLIFMVKTCLQTENTKVVGKVFLRLGLIKLVLSISLPLFSQAKDKEERLFKRQQNRERMEEKRRQKSAQLEDQGTCNINIFHNVLFPGRLISVSTFYT